MSESIKLDMTCLHCLKVIEATERFATCSYCDKVAHMMCIKLNAKVLDALKEPTGLMWFCVGCNTKTITELFEIIKKQKIEFCETLSLFYKARKYDSLCGREVFDETPSNSSSVTTMSYSSTSPLEELIVVPLTKYLFLSRLHPDTTSEMVLKYIRSRLPGDVPQGDIICEKLEFSFRRKVSSFKIYVPNTVMEILASADFWPKFAIIDEFRSKK